MVKNKSYWNKKLEEGLNMLKERYVFGKKKEGGKDPLRVTYEGLDLLRNAPTPLQVQFIEGMRPERIRCINKLVNKNEYNSTIKYLNKGAKIEHLADALVLDGIGFAVSKSQKQTDKWVDWFSAYETVRITTMVNLGKNRDFIPQLQHNPHLEELVKYYKV